MDCPRSRRGIGVKVTLASYNLHQCVEVSSPSKACELRRGFLLFSSSRSLRRSFRPCVLLCKITALRRGEVWKFLVSVKGEVARPERVELPTFWFVARRSIQLSYGRAEMHMREDRLRHAAAKFNQSNCITPVKNGICTANPCRHRLVKIVRYGLGSRDG